LIEDLLMRDEVAVVEEVEAGAVEKEDQRSDTTYRHHQLDKQKLITLVDEHDPTMSNLITGLIIAAASPGVQVQIATMKKQGVEVAAGATVTVETEAGRAIHTIVGEGRSTSDTDRRESTAVEVTVTTEIERKNTTNIVPEKVTNINITVSIQTKKMIGATVESTKSVIDESIASSNLYTIIVVTIFHGTQVSRISR